MKKIIFTSVTFLLFISVTISQSRYVFIDFKDVQRPAIQNDYSYPEKTVSDAIDDKLTKMGYKSKDVKGYTVYRNVVMPEIGSQPYDYYFKIDRRTKRDKENTTVSMLVSTGNEIFVSDSSDSRTMDNARTFLNNLMPTLAAYDLQLQIKNQSDVVSKAEKKYKSLQNDADDLQKKKKRIEQQIEDNLKDQKNQQAEIEKQRQIYESLHSRQKM